MPSKKKLPRTAIRPQTKEKAYESFVGTLEVFTIRLKSCSCDIDRGAVFDVAENGLNSLSQSYEVLEISEKHFEAEGRYVFTMSANEEAQPVLSVRCSFVAHIHSERDIPKEYAARFAQFELRLVLMPYARQFVSNLTSQMSIPPVLLPLLKR